MTNKTISVDGINYSVSNKTKATRIITREDGTVLGEAFKMAGDREWLVRASDFRGNTVNIYRPTLVSVIKFLNR